MMLNDYIILKSLLFSFISTSITFLIKLILWLKFSHTKGRQTWWRNGQGRSVLLRFTWKKSYDKPEQHIRKHRYHFANKGPYGQGYGFSCSHVRRWCTCSHDVNVVMLDHKEDWVLKNWCFQTVVLEKTQESLGQQEVQTSGGLVPKLCLTLVTPWTVALQIPLSMGFSRQEYWSWLTFPSPQNLLDPGIEPGSPALHVDSCIEGRFFTNWSTKEAPSNQSILKEINPEYSLEVLSWSSNTLAT